MHPPRPTVSLNQLAPASAPASAPGVAPTVVPARLGANVPRATAPVLRDSAGRERPVFLDETGRRARLVRVAGVAAGAATTAWLAALLVGALVPFSLPALRVNVASTPAATPTALGASADSSTAPVSSAPSLKTQFAYARLTARPHGVLTADVDLRRRGRA